MIYVQYDISRRWLSIVLIRRCGNRVGLSALRCLFNLLFPPSSSLPLCFLDCNSLFFNIYLSDAVLLFLPVCRNLHQILWWSSCYLDDESDWIGLGR
ncbi:hypothetical protein ACP275_08G178900 [Erythranthe tilingii]